MGQLKELQSSLRESYATLSDYKRRHDPTRQLFYENPCPVLILQDWKDLEESKEYPKFAKTAKHTRSPALFLPQQGIETLVVPLRKRQGSSIGGVDEISIGSSKANDVYLNNKTLSREHAIITERDGLHYIHDAGSTNGTWHRGSPIGESPHLLKDEDYVSFAGDVARFRYFSVQAFIKKLDE